MGFDADTVRAAVRYLNSDVDQVITELVQRAGIIPDDWYPTVPSAEQPSTTASSSTSVHTNSSSDTGASC